MLREQLAFRDALSTLQEIVNKYIIYAPGFINLSPTREYTAKYSVVFGPTPAQVFPFKNDIFPTQAPLIKNSDILSR